MHIWTKIVMAAIVNIVNILLYQNLNCSKCIFYTMLVIIIVYQVVHFVSYIWADFFKNF